MASKLGLVGTETLQEIRDMIQELKVVEGRLANGNNRSGPSDLLAPNELLDLEKFTFDAGTDKSLLAVPNPNVKAYTADFADVIKLDSDLLAVKNNLINIVKAAINENSLSKCLYKNIPKIQSSPEETPERTPPRRKDSYTIHRFDKPSPPTSAEAIYYPSSDSIRQPIPIATSTPTLDKTYSTNTYSKKSSPFAVPSSRQHYSNAPFVRNGNLGDLEIVDNANIVPASQRTLTRPPRSQGLSRTETITMNGESSSVSLQSHCDVPSKLHNLSMEEIQSMARIQQESLLSSGVPERNVYKNSQGMAETTTKSIDDDDASGSTGNGAWSNDTYSVSVSNPPSETSSGISSPPAGSLEDIQVEPLRRSMPNLLPRHLSLAPVNSGSLQREAYYNSDLRLSQSRQYSRSLRSPNVTTESGFSEGGSPQRKCDSGLESTHMEPLKRALARADTYLQSEGITNDSSGNANRYATYQVPKQKIVTRGSRIPGLKGSFGNTGSRPLAGTEYIECSDGRHAVTPTGTGTRMCSGAVPQGERYRSPGQR